MKKKRKILKIFFFILVVAFYIGSFILFKNSFSNIIDETWIYNYNNDINYKVYLKKNNFFEEPYLEKNNVYITSLIDYLDIDYNYNLQLDRKVSGSYKYYIKGIISADLNNNDSSNYWSKEYNLTTEKQEEFTDLDEITIKDNIKINYDYYNEILLSFKKEYGLSFDGKLKIVLYVENIINGENKHIEKKDIEVLTIPLTLKTIEVPININVPHDSGILWTNHIDSNQNTYVIYKILSGLCLVLGTIILIVNVLEIVREKEKDGIYKRKLKKILKNYDNIIVNVKSKLNIDGLNVIDVSSFEELIDAHSEVRQPINFNNHQNSAVFVLINQDMAWRYILKRDDVYEKNKRL